MGGIKLKLLRKLTSNKIKLKLTNSAMLIISYVSTIQGSISSKISKQKAFRGKAQPNLFSHEVVIQIYLNKVISTVYYFPLHLFPGHHPEQG